MKLKRVHLDHLQISSIDNMELLPEMTHLHLHFNNITKIENLDFSYKLKYLGLYNNQIKVVEGLEDLTSLVVLDLSNNLITIDALNPDKLPQSLCIINLKGNPCAEDATEYQQALIDAIPNICEIDELVVDDRAMEDLDQEVDEADSSYSGSDTLQSPSKKHQNAVRQAALDQDLSGLQQQDMLALYMSSVMSTTLTSGANRSMDQQQEEKIIKEQAQAVVHNLTSGIAERRRQRMQELNVETEKKMAMLTKDKQWLETELVDSLDPRNSVEFLHGSLNAEAQKEDDE
eukprot:TRINITY_DN3427_c1_g1_i2.p1 TRINITY_DN3427_c1_g1~~TRINITY_DN3427_c1_g1_i2.p1  ORF type:complete len:288 (+),score=81.24 TRINITY_DN3427_c1_g1_i2:681-1544(+)